MKYLVLISLLAVSSCGRVNRVLQGWTGNAVEVCHKGVSYLQFESGVTVQYSQDGNIIKCER